MDSIVVESGVILAGAYTATTKQIRELILVAEDEGFEHAPTEIVHRLDPHGVHIVCHRMREKFPDVEFNQEGLATTMVDVTLGMVVPCEVLLKLQNRKKEHTVRLDVYLGDVIKLEPVDQRYRPLRPFDGQHRG